MNEKVELSKKEISKDETIEDENASGKRGRRESSDSEDNESALKIRKQFPESDAKSDKNLETRSLNATVSNNITKGSIVEFCNEIDKNYGVSKEDYDALSEYYGNIVNEDDVFADFCSSYTRESDIDAMDLSEFHYCTIVDVQREAKFMKLYVENHKQNASTTVRCYDFWRHVNVEKGDVVSIKAEKQPTYWMINNKHGLLVTNPHKLIMGTSIVGSNFCLRQGVLQHFFRGVDCLANSKPQNSAVMTIGTLVHEVLQETLKRKVFLISEIGKIVDEIISTKKAVRLLYDSDLSLKDGRQQVKAYVPQIFSFVNRYIRGNVGSEPDKNFKGTIDRIREIEENIWMPSLGIRGKMDVTVDVTHCLQRRIMPLEVKTGRASFSAEHQGQIVLYNMMMRYTGQKVDAGLLLYIKDNVLHEIKSSHNEERDLIILRNSFADFVTKTPQFEEIPSENGGIKKVWKHMELPEPINHNFACSNCAYKTLCSVYAENDVDLKLPETHAVKKIYKESKSVLTAEHLDYIMTWITMVQLEDAPKMETTRTENLWMMEPHLREEKGTCLCNLKVCHQIVEKDNKYLHTFGRKDRNEQFALTNFIKSDFTDGEYIIVSTDTRVNVSAGYVVKKTRDTIELLLERNIVRQNPYATFHLDKYPYMSTPTLKLANVATLLSNNDITNKLRAIIIDKKPATFAQKLPRSVAEIGAEILFRLNKYQRQAVLRVLAADDYMLIKGMPGTGKTQTLVALIGLLVKMGRSVLVTTHTHSAVDNILLKLIEEGIDFMRLGAVARINSAVIPKSEDILTAECKTPESLEAIYNSKKVVAVTCLAAGHGLLAKRIFDVCLIDESTQVMQSMALRPLYSASKFVLVGDPEQLPPVISNRDARKLGMSETLFDRLDSENNTVTLKLQYRMNRKIMAVSNEITYEGKMKAGNDDVATATLHMKNTMVLESCERWVLKSLSTNLEDSVVVLNTGETFPLFSKFYDEGKYKVKDQRFRSPFEAAIILRLVDVLLKGGVSASSIGVICPYVAQVELVQLICPQIEINTVDQYQGRDKEVILYSCTRSIPQPCDEPNEFDILRDRRRLNVAMTRAKHKLIIIADKMSLEYYEPFAKLFDVLKNEIVDLEDGRDDFSWNSLMEFVK